MWHEVGDGAGEVLAGLAELERRGGGGVQVIGHWDPFRLPLRLGAPKVWRYSAFATSPWSRAQRSCSYTGP